MTKRYDFGLRLRKVLLISNSESNMIPYTSLGDAKSRLGLKTSASLQLYNCKSRLT